MKNARLVGGNKYEEVKTKISNVGTFVAHTPAINVLTHPPTGYLGNIRYHETSFYAKHVGLSGHRYSHTELRVAAKEFNCHFRHSVFSTSLHRTVLPFHVPSQSV